MNVSSKRVAEFGVFAFLASALLLVATRGKVTAGADLFCGSNLAYALPRAGSRIVPELISDDRKAKEQQRQQQQMMAQNQSPQPLPSPTHGLNNNQEEEESENGSRVNGLA